MEAIQKKALVICKKALYGGITVDNYYYMCTNKLCRNYSAVKYKYEKICPLCGTETMVYKIEYRSPQGRQDQKKFKTFVAVMSVLLLISFMLNIYLFFFKV